MPFAALMLGICFVLFKDDLGNLPRERPQINKGKRKKTQQTEGEYSRQVKAKVKSTAQYTVSVQHSKTGCKSM